MKSYTKGFAPLLIIIAVAIVAAIGGGIYYHHIKSQGSVSTDSSAMASMPAATSTDQAATSTADVSSTSSASLRSFLTFSGDKKCDIHSSVKSGQVTGTVYIHGDKMRGDFVSVAGGMTIESHMIRSGDTVSAWTGNKGATMSLSETQSMQSSPKNSQQVSLDQQVTYTCESWTPSDSEFSLPAGVTFIDVSAMMKAYMK